MSVIFNFFANLKIVSSLIPFFFQPKLINSVEDTAVKKSLRKKALIIKKGANRFLHFDFPLCFFSNSSERKKKHLVLPNKSRFVIVWHKFFFVFYRMNTYKSLCFSVLYFFGRTNSVSLFFAEFSKIRLKKFFHEFIFMYKKNYSSRRIK